MNRTRHEVGVPEASVGLNGGRVAGTSGPVQSRRYEGAVRAAPAALASALASFDEAAWAALWGLQGRVAVVGSGGSFAACAMMADALDGPGRPVVAQRPWEFLAKRPQVDHVVVVSHSGGTEDAVAVSRAAEGGANRILVTNNLVPRCPYDELVWTGDWTEKCFLSVGASVVPVALLLASGPGLPVDRLEAAWAEGWQWASRSGLMPIAGRKVSILAGGYAFAAGLDAESRLVESAGPAAVVLHELKDFCHGRWHTTLGQGHAVVAFLQPSARRLWRAMEGPIGRHCRDVLLLEAPEGVAGALEQVCGFQSLHAGLGVAAPKDWGRPRPLPDGGPDLYGIPHTVLLESLQGVREWRKQ